KERCDVVLVLTHQGFEKDLKTGADNGSSAENQAWAIAMEVEGIDLLLTGHTHSVIEPRRLGKTWISQPGRFGNTLTRFDLTLEPAAGGRARFRVASVEGRNLPMRDVSADAGVVAAVAPEHAATGKILATVVATLARPISSRGARIEDTAIV